HTIILITHDADVAAIAERTITISDGKIVSDTGTAATFQQTHSAPIVRSRGSTLSADMSEAVKMAIRSLRSNIFRTALTLLGVVIGVAAVVVMLAIGNGSKENIMTSIESMGTNLLMVRPGAPGIRGSRDVATLVESDATALASLPHVAALAPERSSSITMRYGNADFTSQIIGTWPSYAEVKEWPTTSGGWFTDADVKGYAPVVVLGQSVVDALFPDGEDPIGKYVLMTNIPFEVVGVLATKGATAFGSDQDSVAIVPLSTGFMRIFGQQFLSTISVKIDEADNVDPTQTTMTKILLDRHRTEDFQIRNTSSMMEMASTASNTMTILLGSVAAISLLVGGIGVMNIMLVSVTERTREIGIRMATGARESNILLQFNIEAMVVCGVGGIIGVLTGLGFALAAGSFGLNVAITATPSLIAFLCAFATGMVFGYLPARKAAQLDPVIALSSE
ncbi:MAG: FtsX-like permease family protein, partial [Rhizobiales bacterium]|nr:FtsX-like permease family protein [Hyphomicrobiales bacterium]